MVFKKNVIGLVFLFCMSMAWASVEQPVLGRIIVPVVDLRSKKENDQRVLPMKNPSLLATNLLYGEYVAIIKQEKDEQDNDWLQVRMVEQYFIALETNKSNNVVGWLRKEEVQFPVDFNVQQPLIIAPSVGNYLFGSRISMKEAQKIDEKNWYLPTAHTIPKISEVRRYLCEAITLFLDAPYCWAGRCLYDHIKYPTMSVDCSGLIHLLFYSIGLSIPRNSTSQYLACTHFDHGSKLKPGDLIFWKKIDSPLCAHVALFIGDDEMIESQGAYEPFGVSKMSMKDRVWIHTPLTEIPDGFLTEPNIKNIQYEIHFGTFLDSQEQVKELRKLFLKPLALQ
jgi:cell wall-associated NlpC family hydrolase